MLYEIIACLLKIQNTDRKILELKKTIRCCHNEMRTLTDENTRLMIENRILKRTNCPFSQRKKDLSWVEFDILDCGTDEDEDAVIVEEFLV